MPIHTCAFRGMGRASVVRWGTSWPNFDQVIRTSRLHVSGARAFSSSASSNTNPQDGRLNTRPPTSCVVVYYSADGYMRIFTRILHSIVSGQCEFLLRYNSLDLLEIPNCEYCVQGSIM